LGTANVTDGEYPVHSKCRATCTERLIDIADSCIARVGGCAKIVLSWAFAPAKRLAPSEKRKDLLCIEELPRGAASAA